MSKLNHGQLISTMEQIQLNAEKAAGIAGVLRHASQSPESVKKDDISLTAEALEDMTVQVSMQLKALLKYMAEQKS